MKVLILADELFAMRERSMLARLELGLADEGVRVIHAIPKEAASHDTGGVFSRAVVYETSRFAAFRRILARRLADTIRDPEAEEDDQPVSIVHVFGGSIWDMGQELAAELKSELVLELWRPALRERAERIALASTTVSAPVFTVPDPKLERLIHDLSPKLTIRTTPWGVHVEDKPHELLGAGKVPTAVIIGGGHDRGACSAALAGLAEVLPHHRDLMIFIDSRMVQRGDLWSVAKKLGLLASMSLIEDIEARRDLLTQADLLILPESRGEHHSVVLEAMAAPMAVIAAADPAVGTLIAGRTARLVDRPDAGLWAAAIRELLTDPQEANRLAMSAREFVRQERTVFKHVRGVLELYQWMTSAAAIPIATTPGSGLPASGTPKPGV